MSDFKVEIALVDTNQEPLMEDSWDERDQRTMRQWIYDSLRREECRPVHLLLNILNKAVWEQAYDAGWTDAEETGESKVKSHATPIWKDGYERGYSECMSQKGDT